MDQPRSNSRLRQEPEVFHGSDRQVERRAAIAHMMAENREGLGMKVIAVMVQRYVVLPKELWDLNSISDMGAERGVTYDDNVSKATVDRMTSNNRYRIVSLTIGEGVRHKVELPCTLRQLKILAEVCDYPLHLPSTLRELSFGEDCRYDQPLVLPDNLLKLELGPEYNQTVVLPSTLVELELGTAFNHRLDLPQRLKSLYFVWDSQFNHPITLPDSLTLVYFNDSYNQPTILPSGIQELRIGCSFDHDLSLPNTLRRIVWNCNRPIQIPHGVSDVEFWDLFDQPVILPSSVKKASFGSDGYCHPVAFPVGLEELDWYTEAHDDDLVLPQGLRKLSWKSDHTIRLPTGLKELAVEGDLEAPLVLPDGLLKITFNSLFLVHHNLPESIQEVTWFVYLQENIFTHPTTLQHLIMKYGSSGFEVDLSPNKIHKLTIGHSDIKIKHWPQGLKELEFTVDGMNNPLRVPKGCKIVGEKRPWRVFME